MKDVRRHHSTTTINILTPKGQLRCRGWGVGIKNGRR